MTTNYDGYVEYDESPARETVFQGEPVAIASLISAGIAMVSAIAAGFFGWTPTPDQLAALASVEVFITLVVGFVARGRVTPNTRVAMTHEQAELLSALDD